METTENTPVGWTERTHNEGQVLYSSTLDVSADQGERTIVVVTDFPIKRKSNHHHINAALQLVPVKLLGFPPVLESQRSDQWELTLIL